MQADQIGSHSGTYTCASAGAGASGIAGDVILRPILPVERPGMVNQRPYQAVVTITDEAGRTVTAVTSGPDGRFEANVGPGTYRLRPESDVAAPRAPEQTVTVVPGRRTLVRIVYDSGIR